MVSSAPELTQVRLRTDLRILLPIIQFPPDVNPTGVLMAQLCEGLVGLGHEVSVITAFPHYEKFRVWDEYRHKWAEHERHGAIDP